MIELREIKAFLNSTEEITQEEGAYIIKQPVDIAVFNYLCEGERLQKSLEGLSISREKINLIIPNILR